MLDELALFYCNPKLNGEYNMATREGYKKITASSITLTTDRICDIIRTARLSYCNNLLQQQIAYSQFYIQVRHLALARYISIQGTFNILEFNLPSVTVINPR